MKAIRTIQIPLRFSDEDDKRLHRALAQSRAVAEYAGMMLPSHFDKGQIPIPQLPKQVWKLCQKIDKEKKVDTSLLSSSTVQEQVSVALANFRSSSSNWKSKLYRTQTHVLLTRYKLWGWLIKQMHSPPAKKIGGKNLLKMARDQVPNLRELLIKEITIPRKPVNNSNRPTFGNYNTITLHNRSIEIEKSGEDDVGITLRIGKKNKGGWFTATVQPSKIKDRSGLLREFGKEHYQEGWCELTLEAILRQGSGIVRLRDGQWWLNLTVSQEIDHFDAKVDTIDYLAGIHGGIYRPMSLVVLDAKTGKEVFHYLHSGKQMIHAWKTADTIYAARQEKTTLRREDQRPITKKNLSIKYQKAAAPLSRASRILHHELHNATRMVVDKIGELKGNVMVCIHDFTGARDKAGRLKNMTGCEEDKLPPHIRRIANRWPFHVVDWQLTYKLKELPNVVMQKIPLTLACHRCSVCGGSGEHGDTGKTGTFYEHWHHWFRCGDCGRQINADRNAATNASHFAGVLVENRELIMSDRVKNRKKKLEDGIDLLKTASGTCV